MIVLQPAGEQRACHGGAVRAGTGAGVARLAARPTAQARHRCWSSHARGCCVRERAMPWSAGTRRGALTGGPRDLYCGPATGQPASACHRKNMTCWHSADSKIREYRGLTGRPQHRSSDHPRRRPYSTSPVKDGHFHPPDGLAWRPSTSPEQRPGRDPLEEFRQVTRMECPEMTCGPANAALQRHESRTSTVHQL